MFVRKLASLCFALALVYSISLPARAELLKNFKMDGSIETKSFGIDNETDRDGTRDDYRGETRTRIMVGGSFDLLDDVHSRVLLRKNNRLFGQNSAGVTPAAGSSENLNDVQSALAVDNAYVKIDKVFSHIDLTVGRQFYSDGGDLNIYFGLQPDDLLNVTALDIFRADADLFGVARFQGIAGKLAETTPTSATNPPGPLNVNSDTDLWGGEVNTANLIPHGSLAASYYTRQVKTAGPLGNDTLNSASLRLMGDFPWVGGLNYNAQFVQDFGRNNSIPGTPAHHGDAWIVGIGWGTDLTTKQGAAPIRVHGEAGRGSDDFVSIAAGKRFGKIWGEHTNAIGAPSLQNGVGGAGLTNLKVADLGAGVTCPVINLGVDLNWYRFMYDRATTAAPGSALTGSGGTPGKSSAGSELDLILSHKHSENVTLEASLARFFVGDALQNFGAPTNPITRVGGDVKIKF